MQTEFSSSELQQAIAKLWCSILNTDRVNLDDRFYGLGGDSMSAIELLLELKQDLGVEVAPDVIFASPTLEEFAAHVHTAMHRPQSLEMAAHEWPAQGERPCSVAQEMAWLLEKFRPETPLVNRAKSVRLTGQLNLDALRDALRHLVARHEPLRTTVTRRKRKFSQVVHEPADVRLEIKQLGAEQGPDADESLGQIAGEHFQGSLNLSDGPVARYLLVQRSPSEHLLLCNFHYAAFDAWSLQVWLQELASVYQARVQRRQPQLPALPLCYADYAHWQRAWLQSEAYRSQVEFWRGQLPVGVGRLTLPTDRARTQPSDWRGETLIQRLPPDWSRRLKRLARTADSTLFMLLLATFKRVLARWCGQSEVLVGAPVAGRDHAATRRLIGRFTDTIVLRTEVDDSSGLAETLRRIRAVAAKCYAHQGVPLIRLHKELQTSFGPGDSWFDVLFQVTPLASIVIDTPEMKFEEVHIESGMAPLDISVFVTDDEAGLLCRLEYKTGLFDRLTMRELMGQWRRMIEELVDGPDEI